MRAHTISDERMMTDSTATHVKAHSQINMKVRHNLMSETTVITKATIQAQEQALNEKQAEFAKLIPTLQFGSDEYDAGMSEYLANKAKLADIPALLVKATIAENTIKIDGSKQTVITALASLIATLKLDELLGEPLETLVFINAKAESEQGKDDGRSASINYNPKKVVKSAGTGTRKEGGKRPTYTDGTQSLNATDFVKLMGNAEQKEVKYPHTKAAQVLEANPSWSCVKAE